MQRPLLDLRQAVGLLAPLGDLAKRITLVDGQALNFWAERYAVAGGPHTSKDIDFCGGPDAVTECARLLGGKAHLAPAFDDATPNSGKVTFLDGEGHIQEIDFLRFLYGLTAEEVKGDSILLEIPLPSDPGTTISLRVMHPAHVLKSRIENVAACPNTKRSTPSISCEHRWCVPAVSPRRSFERWGQSPRSN